MSRNVQQDVNNVADAVIKAGFKGPDVVTMIEIAGAESTFEPTASNGDHFGLFQISSQHNPTEAEKTEAVPNAKVAYRLYMGRGGPGNPHRFDDWAASKGNWAKWEKYATAAAKMPAPSPDSGVKDVPNAIKAVTDVPGAITSGFNAFTSQLAKIAGNVTAVLLALVLLVIGVLLVKEQSIVKTVSKVLPT